MHYNKASLPPAPHKPLYSEPPRSIREEFVSVSRDRERERERERNAVQVDGATKHHRGLNGATLAGNWTTLWLPLNGESSQARANYRARSALDGTRIGGRR